MNSIEASIKLSNWLLKDWRIEWSLPKDIASVLLIVPHNKAITDAAIGLASIDKSWLIDHLQAWKMKELVKAELFTMLWWLFNNFFRSLWGMPVNRKWTLEERYESMSEIWASILRGEDILFSVAPSGTRSSNVWKKWAFELLEILKENRSDANFTMRGTDYKNKIIHIDKPHPYTSKEEALQYISDRLEEKQLHQPITNPYSNIIFKILRSIKSIFSSKRQVYQADFSRLCDDFKQNKNEDDTKNGYETLQYLISNKKNQDHNDPDSLIRV